MSVDNHPDMTQAITGSFHIHAEALAAAQALHGEGIAESEISVVASNISGGGPMTADLDQLATPTRQHAQVQSAVTRIGLRAASAF